MGAAASCGLQLYQYGYTVSIPLFEGEWRPDSFYDRIKYVIYVINVINVINVIIVIV